MSTPTYSAKSPYCEHTLDPSTAVDGWVTCACGHRRDVRWVSELGWLQARGEFVGQQVTASTPWYDTARGTATVAEQPATRPSGQGVLYVLGALSLVTAFAVFTAVAWESIGAIAQGAVLVGGSLVSAFIAVKARARMAGLANTFAFISTAVMGVFLINAPIVGLFPTHWQRVEDGYPLLVLVGLSVISALLGFRLRIAGWIFVSTAAALPVWSMFNLAFVSQHLGSNNVLASSVVSGFLILVALEYLTQRLLATNEKWHVGAILNSLSQALIAFVVMTSSTPAVLDSVQPVVDSLAYAVTGVGFFAVYKFWRRPEGLSWLYSPLRAVSLIFSALTFGLSSAWIFAPARYMGDVWPPVDMNLWRQLLPAAIFGAAAFLVSTFVKNLNATMRLFLTVYGVTVWFFGYFFLSTHIYNSINNWEMFTYFAIIATTSLVCWFASSNLIQFIAGAASGAMALAVLVSNTIHDRVSGPEPYSFTIAVWLALCLTLLRRRHGQLNSAVWFGIPFGTVLIPSAISAVPLAQMQPGDAMSWTRLWTVLVVSLIGTIAAANFRFAGVLWPSAVAYVAATFPQLFVDLNLVVPRWVFFAILGVLLILTAARFERLQQLRRESGSWSEVVH